MKFKGFKIMNLNNYAITVKLAIIEKNNVRKSIKKLKRSYTLKSKRIFHIFLKGILLFLKIRRPIYKHGFWLNLSKRINWLIIFIVFRRII